MNQTGTSAAPNPGDSIAAWADVVVKMWRDKITQLDVVDQGNLRDSFVQHVMRQSGGDVKKVDWIFKKYGIYQDMGVGRETARGNSGDLGIELTEEGPNGNRRIRRQPRPWYSSVFFREVMKLKEFLQFWYGKEGSLIVMNAVGSQAFNQRAKNPLKAKTVGSMRTMMYRERNNARWRKNYHDFGFAEWKSRNKH